MPLALELGDDDLVDVEKPVLLEPDLDERSFHAGKHVVDGPEVDVPCDRTPLRPLEVHLCDPVVLDHGDALLTDLYRDQQFALGGGQRCPARRLAAALGATALPGTTPVCRPLCPLTLLRLPSRRLLRGLLGCRRRVGSSSPVGSRSLTATAPTAAAAALVSERFAVRTCRGRFCGRDLRLDLRLSRRNRNFCRCALGRVLLVLLVLLAKPGQRVPLLAVAGAEHPTGIPASRSGCRKQWPCSVGPHGSGYQCAGSDARRVRTDPGSGRRRAEPSAAGANRAEALIQTRPGPRLDLPVPLLGLGACRFQVLEPRIGLFDLEQFSCELCIRHRHSLRVSLRVSVSMRS